MEREICERIVNATGGRSFVSNDHTIGDVGLAGKLNVPNGYYLSVQVKTTATKHPYKKSTYRFHIGCKNGAKYKGLPVICYVKDIEKAWIFDGKDLPSKDDLYITPEGTWCKTALARDLTIDGIVEFLRDFLRDNKGHWPLRLESEIRGSFQSEEHRKEWEGIDLFNKSFPGNYAWPSMQGTQVDQILTDDEQNEYRLQHKRVRKQKGKAGFECRLQTGGGKKDGVKIHKAYSDDAFDFLIGEWNSENDGDVHYWCVPIDELVKRGCLKKRRVRLHADGIGIPPAKGNESTWTRHYYIGSAKKSAKRATSHVFESWCKYLG